MSKYMIGLGVSGGIAAYKAVEVMRLLQKAGCEVSVAMTRHATEFVQPLTFRALTDKHVIVDDYDPAESRSDRSYQFFAEYRSAADSSGDGEYHCEIRQRRRGRFSFLDISGVDGSGAGRSGDEHDDVGTAGDAAEYRAVEERRRAFCRAGRG